MRSGEGQTPTDHPQPLLEKRRGDDSGSVDAFSRAILNEKDPVIRGYVENLRAQIAAIAAKHGANARDVWDPAVQAKMSVDEMDAVNDLFKRIKGIGEKKLRTADAREMFEGFEAKESAAQEMLADALSLPDITASTYAEIGQLFLDAGLIEGAWVFYANYLDGQHGPFEIRLLLAETAETARLAPSPVTQRPYLERAMALARECVNNGEHPYDLRDELMRSVYDAFLLACSDRELLAEADRSFQDEAWDVFPLMAARLALEFKRRNLTPTESVLRVTNEAIQVFRDEFNFEEVPSYYLRVAEFHAACGFDPRANLETAIETAKVLDYSGADLRNFIGEIIQTVAKLGQFDLVDSMTANPWWPSDGSVRDVDVRAEVAIGCVQGGNLEKALEFLRAKTGGMSVRVRVAVDCLAEAYLKRNDIRRADEIVAELEPGRLDYFRFGIKHIAARARRGDDVLAEARDFADEAVDDDPMLRDSPPGYGMKSWYLAQAAIATIWNVREMKKRIDAYAKNR